MTILITGAAGFIGFHAAKVLLQRGEKIIGIDNFSAYYDIKLKQARLEQLQKYPNFTFHKINIADAAALAPFRNAGITHILHLAAQAGVRYSIDHPEAYGESNLIGQLNMLELARHCSGLKRFVYASSSSVYGANTKVPFSVSDPVTAPVSLYAATKRSGELLAQSYHHLYKIPMTGLRFFTVYGAWGRPDMAYFSFTKAVLEGKPITLFNNGEMRRDFTYIDDIISGVLASLKQTQNTHSIYNLGNNKPEPLLALVEAIENATGKKAAKHYAPMQPGDVKETFADITESTADLGFKPTTSLSAGIPIFVEWFKQFYTQFK